MMARPQHKVLTYLAALPALLRLSRFLCVWLCCVTWWSSSVLAQSSLPQAGQKRVEVLRLSFPAQLQTATSLHFVVARDAQARPRLKGALRDEERRGVPQAKLLLLGPDRTRHTITTDNKGCFEIDARDFPRRGSYLLRFAGRGRFAPSVLAREIDFKRIDLSMQITHPARLPSGAKRFELQAMLSFRGKALPRKALTLMLSQKSGAMIPTEKGVGVNLQARESMFPLMTLHSDVKGVVRFLWQGKPLQGPARLILALRYKGDRFFLPQTKRVLLSIKAPPSNEGANRRWSVLLSIVIVVGLVLLLWLGLRYIHLRQEELALLVGEQELADVMEGDPTLVKHERIQFARKRKPPTDREVGGRLQDARDRRELPGVKIFWLKSEDEAVFLGRSDWDGLFSFVMEEAEGEVSLKFSHPAYQEKIVSLHLPHYGQARALRIKLQSYRTLIFEVYRRSVWLMKLPKRLDLHRVTAREVLKQMDEANARLLEPIVRIFERSYYAPLEPSAEDYAVLIALWQELKQMQRKEEAD